MSSSHIFTRRQLLLGVLGTTRTSGPSSSLITPVENFYRELRNAYPQVERSTWCLTLRCPDTWPLVLSYEDLRALPSVEIEATLVSPHRRPGSSLISHGRWCGVPAQVLIHELGESAAAPFARIYTADGRDVTLARSQLDRAVVAYALNGEPLPHWLGAPARLIVPGVYDHKSPGWVTHIDLHTQATPDYWERLGRLSGHDVATQAHIQRPFQGEHVRGVIALNGMAYAGLRRISAVEVSIDDAEWVPVEFTLSAPGCWVHWSVNWRAPTPGSYSVQVRATDETGFTQTQAAGSPVHPIDSAIHRITIHAEVS